MSGITRAVRHSINCPIPPFYIPLMSRAQSIAYQLCPNLDSRTIVCQALFFSEFLQPINPFDEEKYQRKIEASIWTTCSKILSSEYQLKYSDVALLNEQFFPIHEELTPSLSVFKNLKGPKELECKGAVDLIFKKAILDLIGTEKFDLIFSKKEFSSPSRKNSIDPFLELASIHFTQDHPDTLPIGSKIYIQGMPWYRAKHPIGPGCGYHAIKMQSQPNIYWALDFKRFYSEEEIAKKLLYHYNQPRTKYAIQFIDLCNKTDSFAKMLLANHGLRLKGYEKEFIECLNEPDIPYGIDDVYPNTIGFYGHLESFKISPLMIHLIDTLSIDEIGKDSFKELLLKTHLKMLSEKIKLTAELNPKPNFSMQEKNYIKWAAYP